MGAPKTSENEKPPNSNSTTSNPEEAFNADIILTQLGPIGWFQLKYLVGVGYSLLFTTAAILIYSFVGGVPAHRCFVEGCDDPDFLEYKADWITESNVILANLSASPRSWRCSNVIDAPSCATNYTVGDTCSSWIFDTSVFTRTIVTDYLLVCDDSWKITFGSFITMLGILLGAFFLGPLPDLIGRRKSVVILGTWISAFGIGSCFAPNYDVFVALRFLTGMGGVAVIQALVIWGLEAMSPSMRVKFICLVYCFQSLGNLISGLLAYFIRDWVNLQLCIFVPLGSMAIVYFFLPESTRWLTVKLRYAEAKEIYEKAAKLNKKEISPHLLEIPASEPEKAIESAQSATVSHDSSPLSSFKKVLNTPSLLIRLLILCATWLAQFLCYYGLSYAASNLSTNIHLNYILVMVVEIPAYLAGIFAMDYLGRRLVLNITLIAGGAFCLVAGLISKDYSTVIIVFSLMGKFCTSMLTVANNAITFELFPTISRAFTIAICSTSGKIGSITAPYIAGLGTTNRSAPYVIFGIISLAVGALTLFLPETRGQPIPSTIQEAIDLEKTKINVMALCRKRKESARSSTTISEATTANITSIKPID